MALQKIKWRGTECGPGKGKTMKPKRAKKKWPKIHGIECCDLDSIWTAIIEKVLNQIQTRTPNDFEKIQKQVVRIEWLPELEWPYHLGRCTSLMIPWLASLKKLPKKLSTGQIPKHIRDAEIPKDDFIRGLNVIQLSGDYPYPLGLNGLCNVFSHECGHAITTRRDYSLVCSEFGIDKLAGYPKHVIALCKYIRLNVESPVLEFLADMYARKWGFMSQGKKPKYIFVPGE